MGYTDNMSPEMKENCTGACTRQADFPGTYHCQSG